LFKYKHFQKHRNTCLGLIQSRINPVP
jgi:hypothetical protein